MPSNYGIKPILPPSLLIYSLPENQIYSKYQAVEGTEGQNQKEIEMKTKTKVTGPSSSVLNYHKAIGIASPKP
jgi:hypothetical protein